MVWPEMAGSGTADSTKITAWKYGEGIFVKVKWFVVIKATTGSCTCLWVLAPKSLMATLTNSRPIQTYSGRGVSKNVVKHHHAIIYTGISEPEPLQDEKPASGRERGMLDSIRVIPTIQSQSLDPMSRINFKKVYTVEYNVKVCDFGTVDRASLSYLQRQFEQVWNEDWFLKWKELSNVVVEMAPMENYHTFLQIAKLSQLPADEIWLKYDHEYSLAYH
jgi:hypothetical protein